MNVKKNRIENSQKRTSGVLCITAPDLSTTEKDEKNGSKFHSPSRTAGLFLCGLSVFCAFPLMVSAQSTTPKNFLERLRPPFVKSQEEKSVPEAPNAFSEPEPVSSNGGWSQIGTSYSTPSSAMTPDATSSRPLVSPSNSYNPSTRSNTASISPINTVVSEPIPTSSPISAGTSSSVPAEPPINSSAANGLPAPFPVNQREFHLPFGNFLSTVPQEQLKEVRLYVSRDNGANWKLYQTMSREKIQSLPNKNFPVATASDGEFWFAVRVVNQQGGETPGVSAPPTWRVIVNTTGKSLDSLMNHPETSQISQGNGNTASGTNSSNPVTNTATTSSGNGRPQWSPNPDGSLAAGASTLAEQTSPNRPSQNPNLVIFSVKDRNQSSIPDVSLPVYKLPNSKPLDVFQTPAQIAESAKKEQKHAAAKPETETETDELGSISLDAGPETLETAETSLEQESTGSESGADDMVLMLGDSSTNEEGLNSRIRYMNQPQLSIDYDVSMVGSSGVGRVELWGTMDDGQTWTYMADDKDCASPIDVTLKSDGKYGFQILVFNGAGVGMERPQSGSMPQMEVVLDRINPRVQLYGIQLQAEFGDLEITWGAEDLNLGSNPVLLSWSSSTEGPWRAMTPMPLENTGRYTWRIPEGIPGKVFLRIDVCDLAKNSTTLVTGPAVTDIVRPTGVILDAKPAGSK